MNKPVAWMLVDEINGDYMLERHPSGDYAWIPLYTHPPKDLHLSLQKSQDGELLAVTYTDDEHRIVEVLWQKPPVKELTDEEIIAEAEKFDVIIANTGLKAIRAILKKAQD